MVNTAKNVLIMLSNLQTDALKWVIQEIAQPTSDLIGNTIANKIMKVSRSSSQNNPKTVTNENDKEVHKEKHISLEERHY